MEKSVECTGRVQSRCYVTYDDVSHVIDKGDISRMLAVLVCFIYNHSNVPPLSRYTA